MHLNIEFQEKDLVWGNDVRQLKLFIVTYVTLILLNQISFLTLGGKGKWWMAQV